MTLYTVIYHGSTQAYLRFRGFITEGSLIFSPYRPCPSIEEIKERIARHYAIRVSDLESDRRSRDVARPRQVAMYLARQLTPQSLPMIGRRFGNRDHTTVIHAIRTIKRLRCEDDQIATDVLTLEKDLAA